MSFLSFGGENWKLKHSPFLEEALRDLSFSLFGLALTLEAATSCAVLAAISCDATTISSNLPVPVTTLSAASLPREGWRERWIKGVPVILRW